MNTFNVLIYGNFDDIRGDTAIYLLERAQSGSCNVYFSGFTGSVSGKQIINHTQGNFTASIGQMRWTSRGNSLINQACLSTNPKFDLIIYPTLENDWVNFKNGSITASNYGIPLICPHYNDSFCSINTGSFYGFLPTIITGWGNYSTNNTASYGNQLEFFDTVIDGKSVSASILLYGDSKGLVQSENSSYLNTMDISTNELNAVSSVAAKYINLVQALSSSYVANSGNQNTQIYTNYVNYKISNNPKFRQNFYFDVRQYLREASTFSSSGWTPQQGFGMIQVQNYTGSSPLMPNLTSSFNYTNLGTGTPMFINVTNNSGTYKFTWVNYTQTNYKNTRIEINGRTVYQGADTMFNWVPNITTDNAIVKFYTVLHDGSESTPESNSIIYLGAVTNQTGIFSKLWYGYSCANDGTYIAIGSANPDESLSGVVDILQYDKTTNTYKNKLLIKKLVNPVDYSLLLATEDNTLDINDNPIGDVFLTTELSSSFDVYASVSLGTEQVGISEPHKEIQTENGLDLYATSITKPYTNDPMDLEVDSVFNLISSHTDNFGKSVSLNNSLLAVGCPNFTITFTNGDMYDGGSVDIFDLNSWVSGEPYYPIASLSADNDGTFGESVSLSQVSTDSGSLYLAIGSSTAFSGYGAVYIYQRNGTDNTDWSLIQTIYGPSVGSGFGGKVKFEQSGVDYTLVIGNSNQTNNSTAVYIYELNNSWSLVATLYPNNTIPQTLPYLNDLSPIIQPNICDGYGNSIAIYGNNLIVGAPTDTLYSEFTGGNTKTRGAVYFYRKCVGELGSSWTFTQKSWGNIDTLIDNNFGYDVDINNVFSVVCVPKNIINFTANYILNTLNKKLNCNPNDSYYDTMGQVQIYDYDISSSQWNMYYTQQKTKDYNYPYLNYGNCIALHDEIFVVGAPCFISDYTNLTTVFPAEIQGYSYVYNMNNLISNCPVGNVFYRDGKIILSNSGSIFDSLMKNKFDDRFSAYDLTYRSTINLYEKQIVCTINPGEFNYSTNPTAIVNKRFFGFKDVDLLLKYANNIINGDVYWWNYLNFNVVEQSLFNMYTEKYDIINTSITPYYTQLSSSYLSWDVDGNDKINLKDMTLIWKYFTDTLTQDDVFRCVETKSKRKTLTDIQNYIENNVIVRNYGEINPNFFQYDYSSSIDVTGSYLAPYITTIGLYSGTDLVAVAKLAQPIKNGGEFPLNILVKWDF
jgi:hypothetical protein